MPIATTQPDNAGDDHLRYPHVVFSHEGLAWDRWDICKGLPEEPARRLVRRSTSSTEADIDICAIYSSNQKILRGSGERLP